MDIANDILFSLSYRAQAGNLVRQVGPSQEIDWKLQTSPNTQTIVRQSVSRAHSRRRNIAGDNAGLWNFIVGTLNIPSVAENASDVAR